MEIKRTKIFSIAAVIITAMIVMAGCPEEPKQDNSALLLALAAGGGGNPAGTTFSIKGTFDSGNYKFSLANAESYSRAVSAESYAIRGELEDGSIIYRLSGAYDPINRTYSASAAGSMVRFSISGAFNESGDHLGSTATVSINSGGDDWTTVSYVIDTSAPVDFTGTPEVELPGGVPEFARGWWSFTNSWDGNWAKGNVLVSQWDITINTEQFFEGYLSNHSTKGSVISVENKGSYYDMITCFPEYIATAAQEKAAVTAFFNAKGKTVTHWDGTSGPQPSGLVYCQEQGGWWSYDSDFDAIGKLIREYYNTDALTKYLINQNVEPVTLYAKTKVRFTNNDSIMYVLNYWEGEHDRDFATSVADLDNFNYLDPEEEAWCSR